MGVKKVLDAIARIGNSPTAAMDVIVKAGRKTVAKQRVYGLVVKETDDTIRVLIPHDVKFSPTHEDWNRVRLYVHLPDLGLTKMLSAGNIHRVGIGDTLTVKMEPLSVT